MKLENIYGIGVEKETQQIGSALEKAATRETAHRDDREDWSKDNPTYGQCDLFTEILKIIYARNILGKRKWDEQSKRLAEWAYMNYRTYLKNKKNRFTVHWSLGHSKYGKIDLARNQFPDETYLIPRPRPLSSEVPITRSWDVSCEMKRRKQLIGPEFIANLLAMSFVGELSPELESFLEGIATGEYFGLVQE